jgi:hypothetical protein
VAQVVHAREQRLARESAAAAAKMRCKGYALHLRRIQASNVRGADADSASDPYADFTLLECDELLADGMSAPSDKTETVRNSDAPSWPAPCQLRIPPGTPAALYLARLHAGAEWKAAARYLSSEELSHSQTAPLLRVRVMDRDPVRVTRSRTRTRSDAQAPLATYGALTALSHCACLCCRVCDARGRRARCRTT